ncbi:hypothetical protein ACSVDA_01465 [Cytobacillus sp. Hm23]
MRSKKNILIIVSSTLIFLLWVGHNPTIIKAIKRNNSLVEVIDVFNSSKDKIVIFKYRTKDGEEMENNPLS